MSWKHVPATHVWSKRGSHDTKRTPSEYLNLWDAPGRGIGGEAFKQKGPLTTWDLQRLKRCTTLIRWSQASGLKPPQAWVFQACFFGRLLWRSCQSEKHIWDGPNMGVPHILPKILSRCWSFQAVCLTAGALASEEGPSPAWTVSGTSPACSQLTHSSS